MAENKKNQLEILLVEDDPLDELMTKKFLKRGPLHYNLNVVRDGETALDFLTQKNSHRDAPQPDLILLDIGLPKMDGKEVLKEIRKMPRLKDIPVVVLSGQI